MARMDQIDSEALRTLRYQHYWLTNLGILKLRRHLNRDELDAAEHVLAQLRAAPIDTPELSFSVSMLEIDLSGRRTDYSSALMLTEQKLQDLNRKEADIYQRLKAMVVKARMFDRAALPQKGFSVALRAACLAHTAQILPVLWEAIGAMSRVLISVKEYDAAVRLVEHTLPQALECEDCALTAYLFSCLADGRMGMAGRSKDNTSQQNENLAKALSSLDRSFEEFSKIEDVKGQCEMLAKRATIMHLNGDLVLANDFAAKYLDIRKAAKEQQ
ncbi:MAG: hypothetical protein Q9222_000185 [Ikaeria aurantiellina]